MSAETVPAVARTAQQILQEINIQRAAIRRCDRWPQRVYLGQDCYMTLRLHAMDNPLTSLLTPQADQVMGLRVFVVLDHPDHCEVV